MKRTTPRKGKTTRSPKAAAFEKVLDWTVKIANALEEGLNLQADYHYDAAKRTAYVVVFIDGTDDVITLPVSIEASIPVNSAKYARMVREGRV